MMTLKGEPFAGFKIQRQSVFYFIIDAASVILPSVRFLASRFQSFLGGACPPAPPPPPPSPGPAGPPPPTYVTLATALLHKRGHSRDRRPYQRVTSFPRPFPLLGKSQGTGPGNEVDKRGFLTIF